MMWMSLSSLSPPNSAVEPTPYSLRFQARLTASVKCFQGYSAALAYIRRLKPQAST
jgi:hypothetical protein